MKKLTLIAVVTVLITPFAANAMEWHPNRDDRSPDRDKRYHEYVSATEMNAIGLASAALIGVGGYLVLRRRKAAQN